MALINPPQIGGMQLALDALAKTIPAPASTTPSTDMVGGLIGGTGFYALATHAHPRLTSIHSGMLDASGMSAQITFARSFAAQPGIALVAIVPGGTQPVTLQVQSWLQDGSGNFIGCTVKGYRSRVLPSVLASLVALLSFDVFGGTTAGVQFSLIAIQAS